VSTSSSAHHYGPEKKVSQITKRNCWNSAVRKIWFFHQALSFAHVGDRHTSTLQKQE